MTMTFSEFCLKIEEGVEKSGWAYGGYVSPTLTATAVAPLMTKPVIDYTEAIPPMVVEKVYDRFARELQAVIREAGEGHYCSPRPRSDQHAQFRYVYNDQPDCVVGRVLHRMGVSTTMLSKYEGTSGETVVRACWGMGDLTGSLDDQRVVRHMASAAQTMNDGGMPWGVMRGINPRAFL